MHTNRAMVGTFFNDNKRPGRPQALEQILFEMLLRVKSGLIMLAGSFGKIASAQNPQKSKMRSKLLQLRSARECVVWCSFVTASPAIEAKFPVVCRKVCLVASQC